MKSSVRKLGMLMYAIFSSVLFHPPSYGASNLSLPAEQEKQLDCSHVKQKESHRLSKFIIIASMLCLSSCAGFCYIQQDEKWGKKKAKKKLKIGLEGKDEKIDSGMLGKEQNQSELDYLEKLRSQALQASVKGDESEEDSFFLTDRKIAASISRTNSITNIGAMLPGCFDKSAGNVKKAVNRSVANVNKQVGKSGESLKTTSPYFSFEGEGEKSLQLSELTPPSSENINLDTGSGRGVYRSLTGQEQKKN